MKPTIDELAIKYRSDKTPAIQHGYTPYYQTLFGHRDVRKMLEIGIGYPGTMPHVTDYVAGASLFMWEEYWPEAEIYAVDNKPEILINHGRIHSMCADQGDERSMLAIESTFGRDFDLIIEDGSHQPAHQIATARILIPLVAPGGLYIIEDVEQPAHLAQSIPYPSELKIFNVEKYCNDRVMVFRR